MGYLPFWCGFWNSFLHQEANTHKQVMPITSPWLATLSVSIPTLMVTKWQQQFSPHYPHSPTSGNRYLSYCIFEKCKKPLLEVIAPIRLLLEFYWTELDTSNVLSFTHERNVTFMTDLDSWRRTTLLRLGKDHFLTAHGSTGWRMKHVLPTKSEPFRKERGY